MNFHLGSVRIKSILIIIFVFSPQSLIRSFIVSERWVPDSRALSSPKPSASSILKSELLAAALYGDCDVEVLVVVIGLLHTCYLLIGIQFLVLNHHMFFSHPGSSYILSCYFTNWAQYRPPPTIYMPTNIDPCLCTHLLYAFATITNGKLATYEWDDVALYGQFNDLKNQ